MMYYGSYFGHMRTRMDLGAAQAKAESATRKAEDVEMELEMKIDKLSLITQALWSFIRQNHSMTDDALMDKVKEIDMRDGILDGKVSKGRAKQCPDCNRVMNKMHSKCLYCGHEGLSDCVFENL